jgi:serralysin
MTNYVELVDVTGVANRVIDATAGDTLTIKQGVVIQTTNTAYQFTGGTLNANIAGTITAGPGYALNTGVLDGGNPDTGGGSRISISATGSITSNEWGVSLFGGYNRLLNAGQISANIAGVEISGVANVINNTGAIDGGNSGIRGLEDQAGTSVNINNQGFVSGGSHGIRVDGQLTLANSGFVSGSYGVFIGAPGVDSSITNLSTGVISGTTAIANFGTGTLTIVNNGQINGAIFLGNSDDSYDGTVGLSSGGIFGQGGNDAIAGGNGREFINGGSGNDDLDGGGGNDAFVAGDNDGDDIYEGGDGVDRISFAALTTGGVAVDIAGQSAGGIAPGNIGNDTILNIEQIIGSSFTDSLFGDGTANQLFGGGGGDTLAGFDGNDRLFGDAGADSIIGGIGRDYLTGGADADTFRYQAVSDSSTGTATRDLILDFVSDADVIANPLLVADTINLSAIDANSTVAGNQAFAFIGYNNGAPPAFTGVAGQLRTYTNTAGVTFAEADTNGDLVADLQIQIFGIHTMAASDFVL